jgi:hypothetical protein
MSDWTIRTQRRSPGSTEDRGRVIYLRRDTAANWALVDPVLAEREVVYEPDTDTFIVGDGKTPYTGLPHYRTDWARDNPTLTRGEKYTDHTVPVRKKGDGETPWKDLPIASPTEKP